MKDRGAKWQHIVFSCLALFAMNAVVCWRLFRVEYLDNLNSNEGTFITFGKFILDHWPHFGWFPLYNAGMPFENTYLPLVPFLVAAGSLLTRYSPAHVFHFLSALAYSLAPVFLFLFARKMSGRMAPSFWAALLWSLFSPTEPIRKVLEHAGGNLVGSRRLMNIVYFGETPHNIALCLIPLALLALARYFEGPSARRFVVSVIAIAAVMLSNAFGIVVIVISSIMLCASGRFLAFTGAILFTAYLLICRFLPPSLIQLLRVNSPLVDGDYRLTWRGRIFAVALVIVLASLWTIARRLADPMLRFAILFFGCFGSISIMWFWKKVGFLPQPHRYDLEMELGICLLIAFGLAPVLRRLPKRVMVVSLGLCVLPLSWVVYKDYWFGRHLIHALAIEKSPPFQQARWIDTHLPGERVLISEYGPWFNLFSNDPQLSAGHEPSAPNWMQRAAVYIVYNDPRGAESIVWLKAFGTGGIAVHGPSSPKFDGLIPRIWSSPEYSIYQVPLRSPSLAHVIPARAVVNYQPVNGVDIEPVRRYVAALEDPSIPPASLRWENPERGRISAKIGPAQVISVQMTYDRGWRARTGRKPARLHADRLGMMVIEPDCSGDCTVDLEFTGDSERKICSIVSLATAIFLLGMLISKGPHYHFHRI